MNEIGTTAADQRGASACAATHRWQAPCREEDLCSQPAWCRTDLALPGCFCSAFTVAQKDRAPDLCHLFSRQCRESSANLAEDRHYYCTSYHVATSAAEEIDTMVKRQPKWYFCQPVSMSK